MKILIIGANGQLGSDLVDVLSKTNEVIPIYHKSEFGENVDIEDYNAVENLLLKYKPDVVINTAAFHNVDLCEIEKENAFNINSNAVRNLAELCKKYEIVVVHISSDYVFDGNKNSPYIEYDMPNPLNVYGMSKLEGENYIKAVERYFLIRTSYLFGTKSSSQKKTNLINTLLNVGRTGKVRLVYDNKISPTFTKDLAEKISELLQTNNFGLYHLTNSGECSIYELANEIYKIEGISPTIEKISSEEANSAPGKAKRPVYSALNTIKLKNAGLSEMRHWKEALKNYLNNVKMEQIKINLDIKKKIEPNNKVRIVGVELVNRITNTDDRGHLTEIYRVDEPYHEKYNGPIRQVYVVENDTRGVIRAFHKHKELWDFFSITNGGAKFILIDDRPDSETFSVMNIFVLNSRNKNLLIVPPGVFHGWMSLTDNTHMLSIASHTYNREKPDEIRIPPDSFFAEWEVKGR